MSSNYRLMMGKKNFRAVCQLRSWFRAVGIETKTGNDIELKTASGEIVQVRVLAPGETADGVSIAAATLTGRKIQNALDAFGALQEALGYEAKQPVDRGTPPPKKSHFSEDFESVAFRHTETRRSPNPSAQELAHYDKVICKSVWWFLSTNQELCVSHQLEFDDLKTYAMMWATNFLGCHALPADIDSGTENARMMYAHLVQRFGNFRELLHKKGRNVLVASDSAAIAQFGMPSVSVVQLGRGSQPDRREREIVVAMEDTEIDEAFVSRRRLIDTSSDETRRCSSAKLLDTLLGGLEHDEMVERLQTAVDSHSIHPDARKLATQRLSLHASTCAQCSHLSLTPEVDEDGVAGEAGSLEE